VIGRLFEKRVVQDPGWAAWARGDDLIGPGDVSGQVVNQHTAMSLLAVYGCVNLIADSIATMPVHTVGGPSEACRCGWILRTLTWIVSIFCRRCVCRCCWMAQRLFR
jgi:hypothetical protein